MKTKIGIRKKIKQLQIELDDWEDSLDYEWTAYKIEIVTKLEAQIAILRWVLK